MTINEETATSISSCARSARELLAEAFEEMERASQQPAQVPDGRLPTGFAGLDAMSQGLGRGSLVVLAGSTGMGKTALALNLARNISLQGEVAVNICALDSSPSALLRRMLASLCSVEGSRIANSRLTAEEWPRLGEAMALLSAAPLFFTDQSSSTLAAIRSRCQKLAAQSSQPLGLVVIDSHQLLVGEPAKQLKDLRLLAAELEACVLLTCQSLPSVELRPGGVPLLHDLPVLDAMQTYPHVIAMLHREDFWNPGTSNHGVAHLMLVKNSDNPLGTLRFVFEPMFSRFSEDISLEGTTQTLSVGIPVEA
jgi:replicative DNA helicase